MPELFAIKERIEKEFGYQFNGVLLNLYRNHNDSVAWIIQQHATGKKNINTFFTNFDIFLINYSDDYLS
ncbi:hypothetical protein BBI01_08055 [Chryseobacterium artocarpi]|uniref:Uncharacterized protein n=1 Tax=Chryseobacterium artocarpi TaxID=1414727 RepID=A0A1B8ZKG0_9FLAO|nr:hypothetical protein [Chryseobacterium artocarpi]OCA72099.1 hypothetical protein BBI01_08055 [Chryseobacterium artocarpi]